LNADFHWQIAYVILKECRIQATSFLFWISIQRDELKSKLRTSLDSNTGNLTKEELALIDELAKITPDSEPAKNLGLVKGDFRLLNSTMPGVLFRGCKVSLGRATFNMVREGPGISGVRLCTSSSRGTPGL
jgi:hypothetical protein